MRVLRVDNYIINKPLFDIVKHLKLVLKNGKLREIKPWSTGDDNIVVTCPNRHHKGGYEKDASLNIYVGENSLIPFGYCRCWSCDFHCSFVYFIAECFESSEDFAKKWLIDNFGTQASSSLLIDDAITLTKTKPASSVSKTYIDSLQNWHPYLAKRGLTREVCELFKVKYDPKTSQIVFPCFDVSGKLLMAPRRSIYYKNFYIDKHVEKPVYCLDYIQKNNISSALVCEGPFDVLTCYTFGYPAIGTFGNPSPSQINAINKSSIKILYLALDNDAAGRRMTDTIKSGLSSRIITKDVFLPPNKKDINELTYEEFLNAFEKAKKS